MPNGMVIVVDNDGVLNLCKCGWTRRNRIWNNFL